jgi:hypothetical protein
VLDLSVLRAAQEPDGENMHSDELARTAVQNYLNEMNKGQVRKDGSLGNGSSIIGRSLNFGALAQTRLSVGKTGHAGSALALQTIPKTIARLIALWQRRRGTV